MPWLTWGCCEIWGVRGSGVRPWLGSCGWCGSLPTGSHSVHRAPWLRVRVGLRVHMSSLSPHGDLRYLWDSGVSPGLRLPARFRDPQGARDSLGTQGFRGTRSSRETLGPGGDAEFTRDVAFSRNSGSRENWGSYETWGFLGTRGSRETQGSRRCGVGCSPWGECPEPRGRLLVTASDAPSRLKGQERRVSLERKELWRGAFGGRVRCARAPPPGRLRSAVGCPATLPWEAGSCAPTALGGLPAVAVAPTSGASRGVVPLLERRGDLGPGVSGRSGSPAISLPLLGARALACGAESARLRPRGTPRTRRQARPRGGDLRCACCPLARRVRPALLPAEPRDPAR